MIPLSESLVLLDPAFSTPQAVTALGKPENKHLLDYVTEDAFGAHVFPGDLVDYSASNFLRDMDLHLLNNVPLYPVKRKRPGSSLMLGKKILDKGYRWPSLGEQYQIQEDITESQAQQLFANALKDFTPKNIILPVLLTPSMLERERVIDFFSAPLCQKLQQRIAEITDEMRVKDFMPIHLYKTPSFRLYFEFREKLFERMRLKINSRIGYPPPLPQCLESVLKTEPDSFKNYVYCYSEDRESGDAHNYFSNGGVF